MPASFVSRFEQSLTRVHVINPDAQTGYFKSETTPREMKLKKEGVSHQSRDGVGDRRGHC